MSDALVIETSALAAIYVREEGSQSYRLAIQRAGTCYLPASCLVEFALLHRLGGDRQGWLRDLLEIWRIKQVAIDASVAAIAMDAAQRYGRGSGHGAKLNFGDCLSYAVARHLDLPLLFKGGDFARTDIRNAIETLS
jgi:ribonuclease VapC